MSKKTDKTTNKQAPKENQKSLSIYAEEIIWELYNACDKNKNSVEIRLNLQPVDYPSSIANKEEVLKKLQKDKIIESYKIETEKLEDMPLFFEEPIDPEITLSRFVSSEDYDKAKKVPVLLEQTTTEYVAIIQCDPKKIFEVLREDYKRINKKKKEIEERKEIENILKKEQVLKCSDLRFGLESGNVVYGRTFENLVPGGQEYKVLKILMENPNKRIDYEKLCQAIFGTKSKQCNSEIINSDLNRSISFIVSNIKKKLKIVGTKKENKNLFKGGNGYMIICD